MTHECAWWKHSEVMLIFSSYCLLAVSLCLCSLPKQVQGPVISSLAASFMADGCPAEYTSAGVHALDSCSTGAADLGVVVEYVHIYALSLTCLCLHPSCKSVFLS